MSQPAKLGPNSKGRALGWIYRPRSCGLCVPLAQGLFSSRSSSPWPGAPGAAGRGILSSAQPGEMRIPGVWVWQGLLIGDTTLMGSAVPVTGESFCDCEGQSEAAFCSSLHMAHRGKDCSCGEEDEYFDWVWDDLNKSSATLLSCDNRKVNFHMEYSCGTAAIRGTKELGDGQHFWEIKMTSPVYGTDMMVGIGTSDVDLDKYQHTFCSLLGRDEDSWGLSYTGLHHWCASGHLARDTDLLQEQEVHRGGSYPTTEQEVLPNGVLHSSQEQHEGDPFLRQHDLLAVPVLLPPAPAATRLRGHP
ncbi:SPRY domain-containing SOCS box protein 3 isoform X3 [Heterocephalus glaber]|uniref:SPRY domain-containing SOCS box protein 3 isoform X3 n=1 Tax=Heterocephalus glaber TaxID=10181 RepID=A0AAX6SEY1_HETGA|nr:SPRY domain-containing SOCS box protein 3 isoform X3 [Heterocephalus glaber]